VATMKSPTGQALRNIAVAFAGHFAARSCRGGQDISRTRRALMRS
jgi:hypothetical protein